MSVSRVALAAHGPEVSRLAQGWAGVTRWNKSTQELTDHVSHCVDLGITTMDNAAIYGGGEAEALLGDALYREPGLRERVELITKCSVGTWDTGLYHYDTSAEHILWSVEQSLKRLRTDRVELLLIHRPDPLMDADEVAEAFTTLRTSGKVLHFGVSHFMPSQFRLLSSRVAFPLVTNEIQCSVMHLAPWRDGTLDLCQQERIRPLAWSPLGGGELFAGETERTRRIVHALEGVGIELGEASVDQVALAWLLRYPGGIVPILGTHRLERLDAAAQAEFLSLTREQWFRIWVASTGERLP